MLGSLQGGPEVQDQRQEHPRMAWIYWVQLFGYFLCAQRK